MKQIIIIPRDTVMSAGKMAAQAAHAAVGACERAHDEHLSEWRRTGTTKIVLETNTTQDLLDICEKARKAGFPVFLVRDEGRTEVAPNSITALAIGPHPYVDSVTGNLPLFKDK